MRGSCVFRATKYNESSLMYYNYREIQVALLTFLITINYD